MLWLLACFSDLTWVLRTPALVTLKWPSPDPAAWHSQGLLPKRAAEKQRNPWSKMALRWEEKGMQAKVMVSYVHSCSKHCKPFNRRPKGEGNVDEQAGEKQSKHGHVHAGPSCQLSPPPGRPQSAPSQHQLCMQVTSPPLCHPGEQESRRHTCTHHGSSAVPGRPPGRGYWPCRRLQLGHPGGQVPGCQPQDVVQHVRRQGLATRCAVRHTAALPAGLPQLGALPAVVHQQQRLGCGMEGWREVGMCSRGPLDARSH